MATDYVVEEHFAESPPSELYHYTDQKGLLGIIESCSLWATKVQYLNDLKEFKLSITIAKDQLGYRRSLCKDVGLKDRIGKIMDGLDKFGNVNICAISFCERDDLLSQWRGYSTAGGGVSIGFRSKNLETVAAKQGGRLGRCIYNNRVQQEVVKKLIDDTMKQIENEPDVSTDFMNFTTFFNNQLIERGGAFFKDDGFQEEKEWRLVTGTKLYNLDHFKFRVGHSMLIPYYEVPLDSLTDKISSVTIGPCPFPEASQQAVIGLSIKHGLYAPFKQGWGPQDFEVRVSNIPYRNW